MTQSYQATEADQPGLFELTAIEQDMTRIKETVYDSPKDKADQLLYSIINLHLNLNNKEIALTILTKKLSHFRNLLAMALTLNLKEYVEALTYYMSKNKVLCLKDRLALFLSGRFKLATMGIIAQRSHLSAASFSPLDQEDIVTQVNNHINLDKNSPLNETTF